jgi:hypothetical protein
MGAGRIERLAENSTGCAFGLAVVSGAPGKGCHTAQRERRVFRSPQLVPEDPSASDREVARLRAKAGEQAAEIARLREEAAEASGELAQSGPPSRPGHR